MRFYNTDKLHQTTVMSEKKTKTVSKELQLPHLRILSLTPPSTPPRAGAEGKDAKSPSPPPASSRASKPMSPGQLEYEARIARRRPAEPEPEPAPPTQCPDDSALDFFLEYNGLTETSEEIGESTAGAVYVTCRPRDADPIDRMCDVAVKVSRFSLTGRDAGPRKVARNELKMHEILSKRAPDVVPTLLASYECVTEDEETGARTATQCIASELLYETLAEWLGKRNMILAQQHFTAMKEAIALFTTRGQVIHGDLHAGNIMSVDHTGRQWKLIDFGFTFESDKYATESAFITSKELAEFRISCVGRYYRLEDGAPAEMKKMYTIAGVSSQTGSQILFRRRKLLNLFQLYNVLVNRHKVKIAVDDIGDIVEHESDEPAGVRFMTLKEDFPELPADLVAVFEAMCKSEFGKRQ